MPNTSYDYSSLDVTEPTSNFFTAAISDYSTYIQTTRMNKIKLMDFFYFHKLSNYYTLGMAAVGETSSTESDFFSQKYCKNYKRLK